MHGDVRMRCAAAIIAFSTMLILPVSWDLIVRADLLSPNRAGVPSLPNEVLTIACLPVLIGVVLTAWSLRTHHGRTALAVALTIMAVAVVWRAYHFSVVVPEIRAAQR